MANQDQAEFEMYRDPFRMLTLLVEMICDVKGIAFEWDHLPQYDNAIFEFNPSPQSGNPYFYYKKDGLRIEWFQTFGRDIHSSRDLSRTEYNRMFVDCMSSLYDR